MGDMYVDPTSQEESSESERRNRWNRDYKHATKADFNILQPLLHAIVALMQITMVSILVRKFNGYYADRPVFTTMITNAVRLPDPSCPRLRY